MDEKHIIPILICLMHTKANDIQTKIWFSETIADENPLEKLSNFTWADVYFTTYLELCKTISMSYILHWNSVMIQNLLFYLESTIKCECQGKL